MLCRKIQSFVMSVHDVAPNHNHRKPVALPGATASTAPRLRRGEMTRAPVSAQANSRRASTSSARRHAGRPRTAPATFVITHLVKDGSGMGQNGINRAIFHRRLISAVGTGRPSSDNRTIGLSSRPFRSSFPLLFCESAIGKTLPFGPFACSIMNLVTAGLSLRDCVGIDRRWSTAATAACNSGSDGSLYS